jgi:hypothetical protein
LAHEDAGALELSMAGALRHIARHYDRVRAEIRQHPLERFDEAQVGVSAEVKITQMQQLNGHESSCTV